MCVMGVRLRARQLGLGGNRRGVAWVCISVIRSLQAGSMVEDQRGSELSLHHPAPKGPRVPCCWLLTPLFKDFQAPSRPLLY